MNIPLIYKAIEAGQLFELSKHEQLPYGEALHFKRRLSTFRFLKKIQKDGEPKYSLLKGNEKARFGTLRELWDDYLEKFPDDASFS